MLVGIDIGGTKIAIRTANAHGKTLVERRAPTDATRLVPALKQLIAEMTQGATVSAIGIGIPGMVDPSAGTVVLATNLNIYEPLDLVGALSAEFNCPVAIENDVRLAAQAISHKYQIANLVYMSISTGVSAGLILNGKLWRGANGMAGEIGQIYDDAGTRLEDKISGPAVIRAAHAHGLEIQYASDLFELAVAGDGQASAVAATIGNQLANALLWIILSYDVDKIVLGGGVAQSGDPFLTVLRAAMARLRSQSPLNQMMLPDNKVERLPADFNAGLYGAVNMAKLIC